MAARKPRDTQNAKPGVTPTAQANLFGSIPPEVMAAMRVKVEQLMVATDEEVEEDSLRRILLHREIIGYLVENPPLGRTSSSVMLRAAKQYIELSDQILGQLETRIPSKPRTDDGEPNAASKQQSFIEKFAPGPDTKRRR